MNHLIAEAYLKNKKIDVEQQINAISNIIRNSQQETTYQKLLLEQINIELRINELYTNQPIDLSLSKNQNSPLNLSEKTIQLLENPYITKEEKIEIIQKRRENLQAKQKQSTINFKIYFISI